MNGPLNFIQRQCIDANIVGFFFYLFFYWLHWMINRKMATLPTLFPKWQWKKQGLTTLVLPLLLTYCFRCVPVTPSGLCLLARNHPSHPPFSPPPPCPPPLPCNSNINLLLLMFWVFSLCGQKAHLLCVCMGMCVCVCVCLRVRVCVFLCIKWYFCIHFGKWGASEREG